MFKIVKATLFAFCVIATTACEVFAPQFVEFEPIPECFCTIKLSKYWFDKDSRFRIVPHLSHCDGQCGTFFNPTHPKAQD